MAWIQFNRTAKNSAFVLLSAVCIVSSIYSLGYPWTCEQAIQFRSLANLRLRQTQNEYPPGTPYRKFREAERKNADTIAKAKCQEKNKTPAQKEATLKFFLKYRSDY